MDTDFARTLEERSRRIGLFLRWARKMRCVSLNQARLIKEKYGVALSQGYWSRTESGTVPLHLRRMLAICAYLNVDPALILDDENQEELMAGSVFREFQPADVIRAAGARVAGMRRQSGLSARHTAREIRMMYGIRFDACYFAKFDKGAMEIPFRGLLALADYWSVVPVWLLLGRGRKHRSP